MARRRTSAFPSYVVIDGFVHADRAAELTRLITQYASTHDLPVIERHQGRRPLRYEVIDGEQIREHLHPLVALSAEVHAAVEQLTRTHVAPMNNDRARLNVNITPPGGSYRWHYDRNSLTALLYLNRVSDGELELCPNYRLGRGRTTANRVADRMLRTPVLMSTFGHVARVAPEPGRLVVMRGDRCLHSVRPVTGDVDRVNVVISFDSEASERRDRDELDTYLYSQSAVTSTDPNYRRHG